MLEVVNINFKNGSSYEGEWEDNRPNGTGIHYYPNGSIMYTGEFKNGQRDGIGTVNFEAGGKYEGTGNSYYPDGCTYKGKWKDGKQNGWGVYFYTGVGKYEGEWVNDDPINDSDYELDQR
ncbi:MORN repeat-containing protein [Clostridium estertheticum]|uniref:hypothetical protein n=1 Tax=Clostridium estertheticum TaxID=238834 RepID=UPI001CF5CF46|nr:hypothetical protein [Clostridium estertheticum]MCB2339957.1 hypothetical protein [Clostridium estertheticum]